MRVKELVPFMAESADQLVHISMKGQAESLNVAVAAGILIFHLANFNFLCYNQGETFIEKEKR